MEHKCSLNINSIVFYTRSKLETKKNLLKSSTYNRQSETILTTALAEFAKRTFNIFFYFHAYSNHVFI